MRINEVIVEAISLTKYDAVVEQAIYTGIAESLDNLSQYKGYFPKEEEWANEGSESGLLGKLNPILRFSLSENIADQLRMFILSRGISFIVYFSSTRQGSFAHVDESEMVISKEYIEDIASYILSDIWEIAIENYSDNIADAVFSIIKRAASRDKIITQELFLDGNAGQPVDNLVKTFLHEMVHVIQHHKQLQRGRTDLEYRSYLDKTKDEFLKLNNNPLDSRKNDLYYASPQEISAISQQMALEVIQNFKLSNIKSEEDIPRITSEDILNFMKKRIGNRFGDPRNQKEYAVFKRYAKLVYQEVQRYIDEKRKTFKPSEE